MVSKDYLGHLRKGQFGNGLNRGLRISIDQPQCNSIRHRTRVVGFRYIFDHKQLIGRQISPWKLDKTRLLTAQPNLQLQPWDGTGAVPYNIGGRCPPCVSAEE